MNWGFATVPQKELDNRRMHYPQGRVLGGSTSINAMIYIRGNRLDYDAWRDLGNEVGIVYNPDLNGARQDGVSFYQVTQRNVSRESAATAFLKPVRSRGNLHIVTHATALKIVVEKGRAVGLEYLQQGQKRIARAERGVVSSGGAVNSPKLLLLSGIGPADELRQLGIEVTHNLPGVGKNFQDHMDVYIAAECSQPVSYDGEDRWFRAVPHGIQYLAYKTGPVTACVAEAGCFIRSSEDVRAPDIQIHCLPAYVVDHGPMRIKGHGITINTCHLRPRSIGEVRLASANPLDAPAINPNFVADLYDWKVSLEAFKWGRRILAAPAFEPYIRPRVLAWRTGPI